MVWINVQPEAAADGPDHERVEAIRRETARIEESAQWSAQGQFEQAKRWRAVNLAFGVPASVLAAVSGATALASTTGRIAAGFMALAAAGFGALLTTLNAGQRTQQATSAANAYLEIQAAARQARLVDLDYLPIDDARNLLGELTARRDEQNKTADPPGRYAYKRAKKNLAEGGQTYEVDSEERAG